MSYVPISLDISASMKHIISNIHSIISLSVLYTYNILSVPIGSMAYLPTFGCFLLWGSMQVNIPVYTSPMDPMAYVWFILVIPWKLIVNPY